MDPVLLIIAHGSRDPRHAATVADLTWQVRALRPDLRVEKGFLDFNTPGIPASLQRLEAEGVRDVTAVPLLLTRAFHAKNDIPALLREAPSRLRIRQSGVLGPHRLLEHALERRLTDAGVHDKPETGLVIAAAGSSDPEAVTVIQAIARKWRRSGWCAVRPAFATAFSDAAGIRSPADAVRALRSDGAKRVAVARYVICPGRLSDRIACGAEDADVIAPELGDAPELARLLLTRYSETRRAAADEASGSCCYRSAAGHGYAVPTAPAGRR